MQGDLKRRVALCIKSADGTPLCAVCREHGDGIRRSGGVNKFGAATVDDLRDPLPRKSKELLACSETAQMVENVSVEDNVFGRCAPLIAFEGRQIRTVSAYDEI